MEHPKKKLGFWEVARGRLANDLQEDFEAAQIIACERGVKVKVKLEILIHPPDKQNPMYGNLEYKHELIEPPKQSISYQTLLKDGLIIKDAEDPDHLLQISMDLPGENILNIQEKREAEGGKE